MGSVRCVKETGVKMNLDGFRGGGGGCRGGWDVRGGRRGGGVEKGGVEAGAASGWREEEELV